MSRLHKGEYRWLRLASGPADSRTAILFISHKYPPSIGGMQKQSYELIEGMAGKCQVYAIVWDGSENLLLFFLKLRRRVKKLIARHPDIRLIHCNNSLMATFSLFLQKMVDIPVLFTVHGLDVVLPSGLFQNTIMPRLQAFDGIIAVSRATATECINRGFLAQNVAVVNNGVDHRLAEIAPDYSFRRCLEKRLDIDLSTKKLIMTIGRPVKRKGFSWFLRHVLPQLPQEVVFLIVGPRQRYLALARLMSRILPGKLARVLTLMLGISMDEPQVLRALENKKLAGRAFWIADLSVVELVGCLHLAELFVMPNRPVDGDAEGFGLVALEAAICGTPVVASRLEGISDAVKDGENGVLLPAGDREAWIGCLRHLLSNQTEREALGRRGQTYTRNHYGWDRMVDGYWAVFQRYIKI